MLDDAVLSVLKRKTQSFTHVIFFSSTDLSFEVFASENI